MDRVLPDPNQMKGTSGASNSILGAREGTRLLLIAGLDPGGGGGGGAGGVHPSFDRNSI